MEQKHRPRRRRGGATRGLTGRERAARERDIHSRLDGLPSGSHSNHSLNLNGNVSNFKATVMDAAILYDCGEVETREDHVVPRRSITDRQMLRVLPVELELEPIPTRVLDPSVSGKFTAEEIAEVSLAHMIPAEDNRLTWKSDKTLLNRVPADKIGTFKREGSVSQGLNKRKTVKTENEDSQNITPDVLVVDDPNITHPIPYTDNISPGKLKPVLKKIDF